MRPYIEEALSILRQSQQSARTYNIPFSCGLPTASSKLIFTITICTERKRRTRQNCHWRMDVEGRSTAYKSRSHTTLTERALVEETSDFVSPKRIVAHSAVIRVRNKKHLQRRSAETFRTETFICRDVRQKKR